MFVNIDMSATAMHESGPLPEIAAKVLGKRSLNELRMGLPDRDMIMLTRLLKGQSIQVVHRGEQGRFYYKITNLTGPANQVAFADTEGRTTLVSDYFLQRYNRRLNYPFLPCVVVRKNVFLPMEVCEIAPGQRFTKRLNSRQTAEFITATAKPPQVRFNKINQGLNLLRHKNNPYLEEFGLNINQEMEMINARIMEPPRVSFGQTTIRPQSNGWNLQGKRFKQPAELKSWSLVNFAGAVPIQAIQRFIRELITTFAGLGMNVTNRAPPTLNADPQSNIERILKEAWLNAGKQALAEPQLIVCILPNRGPQLYGEIKRITDTVIGVPSQCLQSKFIADAKKQYCANIALKVNVKLGGSNHTLNNGEIPFVSDRPTIVFGIDVSHPFPGSNEPSVAAVTASMDSMATRFVSTIRLQARTEIVSDLSNVIAELLRKFYQKTGMKPQRMIFYRDGVSDSQFQQVVTKEVSAIRQACALLEDGFKPNITFVVVQKRHRARFLPMNRADSDRSGNCVPGLVVDTDITHPFEFDFYLQAHAAIKGTARSAHYYVLYDENQFNSNSLQDLTFKLCHSYARSTGSVSLVPAVYYADLVAARARLHRPGGDWSDSTMTGDTGEMQVQMAAYATVHAKLQDTMYFMWTRTTVEVSISFSIKNERKNQHWLVFVWQWWERIHDRNLKRARHWYGHSSTFKSWHP